MLRQRQSRAWQKHWSDFATAPQSLYALTEPTRWRSLQDRPREAFDGRLFGGCLDTLVHTAGTPHGDGAGFIQRHRTEGVILYLENAEGSPGDVVRAFHRLRWAGWALHDSFGTLPCPVLADVDIGHLPPQLVLVNGAHAQVRWSTDVLDGQGGRWGGGEITQRLD